MTPQDVAMICRAIKELRGALQGFDIGIGGNARTGDIKRDQENMRAFAEMGITRWSEFMPRSGFQEVCRLIAQGSITIRCG